LASSTTGERIEITPEQIGVYNEDEESVVIDADGISIETGTDNISKIKWYDSGTLRCQIYTYMAGNQPTAKVIAGPPGANNSISEAYLIAKPHTDYIGRDNYLRIYSMYSGGYGGAEIIIDSEIALECGKAGSEGYAKTGSLRLVDGILAPSTVGGQASIYIDTTDGDLKVKFGDGTVKTIVTDS